MDESYKDSVPIMGRCTFVFASKMRALLLVLCCCVIVANAAVDKEFLEKFMDKVRTVGDECIAETKASPDDATSLLNHQIPASHEGKCMIFCMHKKFHAQKDDGSLDLNGAIEAWEPLKNADKDAYEKVVTTLKNCEKTEKNSDPCIYAANLAECAITEGKSAGIDSLVVE